MEGKRRYRIRRVPAQQPKGRKTYLFGRNIDFVLKPVWLVAIDEEVLRNRHSFLEESVYIEPAVNGTINGICRSEFRVGRIVTLTIALEDAKVASKER